MQKNTSIQISANRWYWLDTLPRTLMLVGIACLIAILGAVAGAKTTYADGIPGGNVADPVVRAVDIAKPAVVRIITTIPGHLTVHFSNGQNVTFPQNASGGYPLQLSGSGTFISAHGDILTADHVVNPPKDQSLDQFLDQVAAPDVANYINQNSGPNNQVTQDQVAQELQSGSLRSDPIYDPPSSEIFLNTDYTGPLTAASFRDLPPEIHASVDRIEKESSFNQKDVAVIHVNMNDMPSVLLGDSASVQTQDNLRIIGFPGNGDVSNNPSDLLTLSVNNVFVSSIKTTDAGAQVIQVGGNVEHGDSGGPALDTQGKVVGIVSFGLASSDSPGSTAFLQTSNSANELVQALKLDTTPGSFQKAWNQAFLDYAATIAGHWHKAQQEFESIAAHYPLFKAIKPYLDYAKTQAQNEKGSQSPQQQPAQTHSPSLLDALAASKGALIGIGVVILVALILFGVVATRRQGGKKVSTVSTVAGIQAAQASSRAPATPVSPQGRGSVPEDDLTAFGAPPPPGRPVPPTPGPSAPPTTISGTLRLWPCGHMNRPGAEFCSRCGERAPSPPTSRRIEQ